MTDVKDRRRSNRVGSYEYARTHSVHGNPKSLVQLRRPSRVCEGYGIFANRFILRGTPITEYAGRIMDWKPLKDMQPSERKHLPYCLELDDLKCLVGHCDIDTLRGKGVGQFANDAIHPEVSGHENNAKFDFFEDRVYLTALRDIAPHEEILVDYHISYWLHKKDDARLPEKLREWIALQDAVQRFLKSNIYRNKKFELVRYDGMETPPSTGGNIDESSSCRLAKYCVIPGRRKKGEYTTAMCMCHPTRQKRIVKCCVQLRGVGSSSEPHAVVGWKCLECKMPMVKYVAT